MLLSTGVLANSTSTLQNEIFKQKASHYGMLMGQLITEVHQVIWNAFIH